MSGIRAIILCGDFTLVKKKINSRNSHFHHGRGSYLNMAGSILKTTGVEPPVLIFQEGNAIPKSGEKVLEKPVEIVQPQLQFQRPQEGQPQLQQAQTQTVQNPFEGVKWETWYIPMLRGLHREHHGRLSIDFGKYVNRKTFPFLIIALALAAHFLEQVI